LEVEVPLLESHKTTDAPSLNACEEAFDDEELEDADLFGHLVLLSISLFVVLSLHAREC
jgi:hypothetical protein